MKSLKYTFISVFAFANMAVAQDIPQKFVDQFGTMALAATGSQLCSNVELNQSEFQKHGEMIRQEAQADGMTDEQISDMMKSLENNPNILMGSMVEFGKEHNVTPNDTEGFCAAMVEERQKGSQIGQLIE